MPGYLKTRTRFCAILLAAPTLLARPAGAAPGVSDEALRNITFEQKLAIQVPLGLKFQDENGRAIQLSGYFGHKPIILVLGYYECPMLCTMVLNGLIESLEDLKWNAGSQFDVISVSIDPRETWKLAAAKKRACLRRYGREGAEAGWHFLTGREDQIGKLANSVGFRYAYDSASRQYAHPSGLVILTPDGKTARYLFGVSYSPQDLFSALQTAAKGKVGSPIRNLLLLCFHYNPISGKYGAQIMFVIRALSIATLIGLTSWIVLLVKQGRENEKATPDSRTVGLAREG